MTMPRDWCDPPSAFGQLSDKSVRPAVKVTRRHWVPPVSSDVHATAAFREAVVQSTICLHVRLAKNSMQHPSLPKKSFPLAALTALDKRSPNTNFWQAKLTGLAAMTLEDLATLVDLLPGCLPPEHDLKTFLDVAQKRIPPPPDWGWPDT